jgi:plasmid stabilization system protein ParE
MPKRRVVISRKAVIDLEAIESHLETVASRTVASRVIAEILDSLERLAEMPGMGHFRDDLAARYRVWRVFRFLITYRFDARVVYVTRVIHGHRDIPTAFAR